MNYKHEFKQAIHNSKTWLSNMVTMRTVVDTGQVLL